MIQSFNIKDFGPIKEVSKNNVGKINLIIGSNGSGKTILLKALYASVKTTELYGRGKGMLAGLARYCMINSTGHFRWIN